MTPAYWDSIRAFATKTNLRVIFGLSTATVENAQEFIAYTAKDKPFADAGGLLALSWGNELTGGQVGRSLARPVGCWFLLVVVVLLLLLLLIVPTTVRHLLLTGGQVGRSLARPVGCCFLLVLLVLLIIIVPTTVRPSPFIHDAPTK